MLAGKKKWMTETKKSKNEVPPEPENKKQNKKMSV